MAASVAVREQKEADRLYLSTDGVVWLTAPHGL